MKIYHLIAIVAMAIISGCSQKENTPQPTPNAKPIPLKINVGVDRLTNSKAGIVTGEAFTDEQKINVILVDKTPGTGTPEYPAMLPFQCSVGESETTWSPVDVTKSLKVVANKALVLAHYPDVLPNNSELSADKRTLTIDIPSEIPYGELEELNFNAVKMKIESVGAEVWFAKGDDDYMTGNGGEVTAIETTLGDPNTAENRSQIVMKHALAMIVVQITMDDTNPEINSSIEKISIENKNSTTGPLTKGSVTLADNNFSPNNTRINYSRTMSKFIIRNKYYFGMLIHPATISNDAVVINCSAGSAKYTYVVPEINWQAGYVYLYELKLIAASGVVGNVSLIDWPAAIGQDVVVD